MLDVFILPAGMEHSDFHKTAESFERLPFKVNIRKVDNLRQVVELKKKNPYYGFFFDVEKIDAGLQSGLHMFLSFNMFDVLVLFKRNERKGDAEYRPRIFRSSILLDSVNMQPMNTIFLETEKVLNGWILEHGYDNYQVHTKSVQTLA